jgi:predicted DNA-binding transcriptional regulator YafY
VSILDRIYQIERLLRTHRVVSMNEIQRQLGVSRATAKRDLEYLRDRLNAPVVWDRGLRGYRLDGDYVLPAVYLSPTEIQALIVLYQLVSRVNPGVAETQLESLRALLPKFAEFGDKSASEIEKRVKILPLGSRFIDAETFEIIAAALVGRRRLLITYRSATRDQETERVISPVRLIYYRDNWYLDAWCHLREGLRSFAVDAIQSARTLDEPALEIADRDLNVELGSGYGIFAGSIVRTAILRFSRVAARWVSRQHWHKDQSGRYEKDGTYLLKVPYSNDAELIGDIMRYGPEVEVVDPPDLRSAVISRIEDTAKKYGVAHSVSHSVGDD